MIAAMFGRTKVVEQLKAHGASLQLRNRLGISWLIARIIGKHQPQRAL